MLMDVFLCVVGDCWFKESPALRNGPTWNYLGLPLQLGVRYVITPRLSQYINRIMT